MYCIGAALGQVQNLHEDFGIWSRRIAVSWYLHLGRISLEEGVEVLNFRRVKST
jgi:hypothetical protein